MKFYLSCEHAGNQVPERYNNLFTGAGAELSSHRGWDTGAYELFVAMKYDFVHYASYILTTRLLVDLNRSLYRRSLFSEFSKKLTDEERQLVLNEFYFPFRNDFQVAAEESVDNGNQILHVSVHSFTPVLNGEARNADIGLLYHPQHGREKEIAHKWKELLKMQFPDFRVRFNYPYLGKTDGHVAALRKRFGFAYSGIELEMCNKFAGNRYVIDGIASSYEVLCRQLS